MYDVVWYTPDRIADANKIIQRLDLAEIIERDVPGDLVFSSQGVHMPDHADVECRVICRNFIGASDIMQLSNTEFMRGICDITHHGSGLAGGMLKAEFWVSDELREKEQIALEREAYLRAMKPWRFGKCARYCWIAFWSLLAGVWLAVRSIPRSLRRQEKRKIRSVMELDRDASMVLSSVVSRKEKSHGGVR